MGVPLFAFWAMAGCGGAPRSEGTVVFASGADLESANPLVTIHPLAKQVQRFVLFVTLARYDSALQPEPYAARDWSFSGDRRTLTFHLHPGIRWQDGVATTAHDAAWTINAARDPETGYPRAADLASVLDASAPDDSTLVLHFDAPQAFFPAVLCELPLLPAHLLRDVPLRDMRNAAFSSAPVGNGPFRFVSRSIGRRWVFERNNDFPAALGGPPGIQRFVVAIVDEATTKFAGLVSGELDFAGIAPSMAELVQRDPRLRTLSYPLMFVNTVVFNSHRPPFDDVRVRRAVSLSIDRERLVLVALAGYGIPSASPVVPDNPLALETNPAQNTIAADSLLDAAGWLRGPDGVRSRAGQPLEFELLTVSTANQEMEELIQSDLTARGIRMRIRGSEMGAFLSRARAEEKDFDAIITGVPGDLSLGYLFSMFESSLAGGALDYAGFHSATLDSGFARVRRAGSLAELADAWHAVQRELERDLPIAWLYHARGVQGMAQRVNGVEMDLRGELPTIGSWSTTAGPP